MNHTCNFDHIAITFYGKKLEVFLSFRPSYLHAFPKSMFVGVFIHSKALQRSWAVQLLLENVMAVLILLKGAQNIAVSKDGAHQDLAVGVCQKCWITSELLLK
jgi:hypothetical protein